MFIFSNINLEMGRDDDGFKVEKVIEKKNQCKLNKFACDALALFKVLYFFWYDLILLLF